MTLSRFMVCICSVNKYHFKKKDQVINSYLCVGDIIGKGDRYSASASMKSSVVDAAFSGLMQHSDTSLSLKGDLSYDLWHQGEQTIFMAGDYTQSNQGALQKHNIHLSINVSALESLLVDFSKNHDFNQYSSPPNFHFSTLRSSGKLRQAMTTWKTMPN